MTTHQADFPYDEVSRHDMLADAFATGAKDENIWSVVEHDDGNGVTYGPYYHFVNVLYWIITAETHDKSTYYEERWEMDNKYDPEDHWSDHPDHPASDWQYEVANGDTRLGYHEWIAAKIEERDEEDVTNSATGSHP